MSSLTGCCFRAAESGPQYALTTSPKHLRGKTVEISSIPWYTVH
ncbi:hypothetical protein T03_15336 [Trichinella britovi]|uniref:Uncharacterized protein n=1 Tax=Trichinella britovi TaxID=45882 RepID=A0A0V1AJ92_TRIBR|nr:hypothetical protein T03_15336 [Trichinella britovi]